MKSCLEGRLLSRENRTMTLGGAKHERLVEPIEMYYGRIMSAMNQGKKGKKSTHERSLCVSISAWFSLV